MMRSIPIPRHQRVTLNVVELLREYERAAGGLVFVSPIDIVLDEYNVVQPDAVFFSTGRVAAIDMKAAIRVPPDLAVEVLSTGTEANDRGRKMRLLARFGVREYWLVDPTGDRIEQHCLKSDRGEFRHTANAGPNDVLDSCALQDLHVDATRLFAR
jgi:Uma2 family endonuclease